MKSKTIQNQSSKNFGKHYLIRRIIITNLASVGIIIATYLWMIYFLSNVSSFWNLFRSKDQYQRVDKVAPMVPFLDEIPEAIQTSRINVTGKTEEGVKVDLYVDGAKIAETISDAQGAFSFTDVPVGKFRETIYAKSSDDAGNESAPSASYTVLQDQTPPEVEIANPKDGEVVKATGHSYKVTGKTETGTLVLVNEQLAITNPSNGEFFATIRLEEGDNEVKIIAKDKALNETEVKLRLKFEKID